MSEISRSHRVTTGRFGGLQILGVPDKVAAVLAKLAVAIHAAGATAVSDAAVH